ncbi:hypothetical protein AB0H83_10735 [Dactylosporangium sp. NPDC050688]|uniref:hypothetical protein n=1 Tax=Dactylosporangium sp. NPDC050688 TaxID=3157217 RepID=UPI0033C39F51
MAVPVPVTLAAVAALAASGAAMLAGAHTGAPSGPAAGPRLAAGVAPMPPVDPSSPSVPGPAPGVPSTQGSAAGSAAGSAPGSAAPVTPGASGAAASDGAQASPSMAPPSPGAVWTAVNCAEVPLRAGGLVPTDAGGPLVPPGATTVTRCETPLATTRPGRPGSGTTPAPGTGAAVPRVLTTGVDRFTAVLNALPSLPVDQACLPITLPVQLSLVFTYPRQPPLAVLVDPACSALIAGDRARSYTMLNPLPVFDSLYAAQPTPP